MRRLLLFRHAKAERSEPGARDQTRVLTERGRKDAAIIGAYMTTHDLVPDRVVASPATRTQQTWTYASKHFDPTPPLTSNEALYDATAHSILNVIMAAPAATGTLLVIGHNPGLHELALMLVASGDIDTRERLGEKLPTSGLAIIDFPVDEWGKLHPHSGRLERFVSPRWLSAATN